MSNRKFDLESTKRNILKHLNSHHNKDGYWELIISDHISVSNKASDFSLQYVKRNLEPEGKRLYYYINLLFQNLGFKSFKKEMKDLLQDAIKKKILGGTATYKYVFVVAEFASNSWVLPAYESSVATSKVKALYFYKFIDSMLQPRCFITPKQSKKIAEQYRAVAKRPKKIVLDFLEDPTNPFPSIDSMDLDQLLQHALKHSF